MSGTLKIKPAGHNMVRNPDAAMRHLDPAGETVEMNSYWLRRLAAEEVEVVEEAAPDIELSKGKK